MEMFAISSIFCILPLFPLSFFPLPFFPTTAGVDFIAWKTRIYGTLSPTQNCHTFLYKLYLYLASYSNSNLFAMVWDVGLRALGQGVRAYKLMEVVVLYHHTRLHTPGYSVLIPRRANTFLCFTFNAEYILNSLLHLLYVHYSLTLY